MGDHQFGIVKATIIFEQEDGSTSTYEIPKAHDIMINEWTEAVDPEIGLQQRIVENTVNIGITLKADFDALSGHVYRRTEKRIAKEVADEQHEKYEEFMSKGDPVYRELVLQYGPKHPDHPEHTHEDCCK